jgi:hypothetical protein
MEVTQLSLCSGSHHVLPHPPLGGVDATTFGYFGDEDLSIYLPGLASNLNPPDLSLPK